MSIFRKSKCKSHIHKEDVKIIYSGYYLDDFKKIMDSNIILKDSCWLWKGYVNHNGYGMYHHNHNYHLVHRLSYEIYNGNIGIFVVRHTCDNKLCINPEHLILGYNSDNLKDTKGKRGKCENLSIRTILYIHDLFNNDKLNKKEISKITGLSKIQVDSVFNQNVVNHKYKGTLKKI